MTKRTITLLVLGFFMNTLSAQDSIYQKKEYQVTHVGSGPVIDGFLNDDAWDQASWGGDFWMHEPYDDRRATHETRFKILYDQEHVYVGIRAYDPAPDSIVSRLTKRDELDGDLIALQFDSYFDLQTAFTFIVSAAGSRGDFYMSANGSEEDETWDAVWWAKTRIDREGYTVEIKIPFSQLRFDRNSGGTWGLQVYREVYRSGEASLWQPISREAPGWVHLLGEAHGFQNIRPKKQLSVTPYAVAGIELFEKETGNPYREDGRDPILNAGVDAKIGVSNNFTLDLTVNPDFGQVEADPSQVNLSAFETYFRERRPFFIEGRNIFDDPLGGHGHNNLFYSRRIGRPPHYHPDLSDGEYENRPGQTNIIAAAKITGKTRKGLSLGIMESITAEEFVRIHDGSSERSMQAEPLSSYFTGSVNKEFNKGNTILGGRISSANRINAEPHLDYLHKDAFGAGLNFEQHFMDRTFGLSADLYASSVHGSEEALLRTQTSPVRYFQRPDADYVEVDSSLTSLQGYGANFSIFKHSGKLSFGTSLSLSSPGLELNDMGFLSSTDEVMHLVYANYSINEPFGIFRSLRFNLSIFNLWDFGKTHQLGGINLGLFSRFNNLWTAGGFLSFDSDMTFNSALRGGPSFRQPGGHDGRFFVKTSTRKKFFAEASFNYKQGREDSNERYDYELELNYRPISNLLIALEPEYARNRRKMQYVSQKDAGPGANPETRYIFAEIMQNTLSVSLRVDLVLTPEMTLQYWGQPFIASGAYSEFKHITDPLHENFSDRFHSYDPSEISLDEEGNYQVTEAATGYSYEFGNPDFNVREFLSNMVFRWEYRPGSYLYLVWSQNRSSFDPTGIFRPELDFQEIWQVYPGQAFLIKLSYRIGR